MLAELSRVSSVALALPGQAVAVVVTVRDFALVVTDAALGPLPSRVAAAASLLILSVVAAKYGTGAVRAVRPRVARAAVAGAQDTLPVTRATPGAATAQLTAEACSQVQALRGGRVIVEGEEPVASLQVVAHLPPHAGLAGPRLSPVRPEPSQDVTDIVDSEAGHRVLASV